MEKKMENEMETDLRTVLVKDFKFGTPKFVVLGTRNPR